LRKLEGIKGIPVLIKSNGSDIYYNIITKARGTDLFDHVEKNGFLEEKEANVIIKKTKDFDPKKRQCKKCRQSVRNKFKVNFDEIVESEVAILKSLPKYDRDKRLKIYY
jgi:hypothetical protein